MTDHEKYMKLAIKEAQKAFIEDEVPIGAIAVLNGKVIAKAHNRKEKYNDATRHAEIEVLKKTANKLHNWYLDGVDIYVTLEPCAMCSGAMINARISSLYFGAYDKKAGCVGSVYNLIEDNKFNHKIKTEGGIMAHECANLLSNFFKTKRKKTENNQ